MSRELKFRAWIKKRKGYRELDQLGFDNQGIEEIWVFPKDGEIQQVYNPLDVVVEQYTGLKDKNSKEIYEGDIVSEHNDDIIGEVVQHASGEWRIEWIGIYGGNSVLYDELSMCEVIGNVHEPPKDFRPEHLKRMGVTIEKGSRG